MHSSNCAIWSDEFPILRGDGRPHQLHPTSSFENIEIWRLLEILISEPPHRSMHFLTSWGQWAKSCAEACQLGPSRPPPLPSASIVPTWSDIHLQARRLRQRIRTATSSQGSIHSITWFLGKPSTPPRCLLNPLYSVTTCDLSSQTFRRDSVPIVLHYPSDEIRNGRGMELFSQPPTNGASSSNFFFHFCFAVPSFLAACPNWGASLLLPKYAPCPSSCPAHLVRTVVINIHVVAN
jgi:hypothetical protein